MKAKVEAKLTISATGADAWVAGPNWDGVIHFLENLTDGVAAGQADVAYVSERTVTTGANDDIDLYGVLNDVLTTQLDAAELTTLMIINKQKDGTVNTTDLTIGLGTNPFLGFLAGTTPTIGPIKPGGVFLLHASDLAGIGAVTDSSSDILRVGNSAGASNTYQICILARTA